MRRWFRRRLVMPRMVVPRRIGLYLFLAVLCGLILGTVFLVETALKPTLISFAEAQAKVLATQALTTALEEEVIDEIQYRELYMIKEDNQGKISMLQPNTQAISRVSNRAAQTVQERLSVFAEEPVYIPLARVLGLEVLAGLGPKVGIRIFPIGTVDARVDDRFEEAGINQTRHRVYLDLEGQMKVVIPLATGTSQFSMELAVAESIIVGDVPQFYFGRN